MIRTWLILTTGIIAISFAAILIRFCEDVPSLVIAAGRMSIAAALFLVWGVARRKIRVRDITVRRLRMASWGGFFLALHFGLWITSLQYTSVASSVVLVTTNPLFVGLFSRWIYGERLAASMVAGIVLSIGGSAMMAVGDGGFASLAVTNTDALLGDLLALAGAIMASAYLMVGSRMRPFTPTFIYSTLVYSFAAIYLVVACILMDLPFRGYRPESYLFLVLLAIVPQVIGHTSINWALEHVRASMVAISILGEPVGSALLAWWFFSETIGGLQACGIAVIFSALILGSRTAGTQAAQRWIEPDQV